MEWSKVKKLFSWHRGGIRRRLLIWGLALLGLALILNTFAGTLYTGKLIKEEAAELQREVASRVAGEIEEFIRRKLDRLLDLSSSASLHELGSKEQRLLALLLLRNDGSFTEVTVMDEKGMEVVKVSERRAYLPAELSDKIESREFKQAIKGESYISQVYTSDKAEPYVTLAVPVKLTPREVIGVVSAEANLKILWQVIGDVKFGSAGYAYLVDGKGNLIAHRDPSLVLKRTNLSHLREVQEFLRSPESQDLTLVDEGPGIMGERVLATYAPVSKLGWAVILEEPVSVALAELRRLERYAFLLLGLGLLVGAFIIVWVSNKITKPIRELHRGAEIIGSGNLDYRVEIRSGDEIEELAQEFNEMGGELKVLYTTLEQQVKQRTRELSALYDVTSTVNQSLELEPVLQGVVKKITEIFHFDATRIFLFNDRMDELHMRASFEVDPEFWARVRFFQRGQSVVGRVAETGEPLIFRDTLTDPLYQEISQSQGARGAGFSFLAVFPIKVKESSFGTIVCVGRTPRSLTPDEIRLIGSVADQIGVAVENANLFQETVKRANELSALFDVAATVNQSLKPDVVLGEVMQKVSEITPFDAARIYLLDPKGKELKLRAYQGISPEFASQTATDAVGVGINGRVVATGKPAIFEDIQTDPRYAELAGKRLAQEAGFRSYIALPLKTKTRTSGVINFLSHQVYKFSPGDVAWLASMANQISVAIENTSLYQETVTRAKEISALYDVTTTVNQSLELEPVLQEVIQKITEIFHFDTMRIYLFNPQMDELHVRASYPMDREDVSRVRVFRRGQGVVGKVAETGEPMIFDDLQSDPRYLELSHTKNTQNTGHRFFAAFPIKAKLKTVGAIVCNGRTPRSLTADEVRLLTSMADHIGVAVENANLFTEVKNKTVELEKINQDLQEANRAKADFLAAMSHELRTPLNVIIGNTDLLKDGFFGEVSWNQRESLEKILRHSQTLLKLINDVLTLTRMDAKKMTLDVSTAHLDEIIAYVRSYVEQLNRDNHLEVAWKVEQDLPSISTDLIKLEEILQNLIGNAFKFTPEGKIEVRVRDLPKEDRIEFTVADTGIGIDESDLEKIFDQFHQLKEAHTGNFSGAGLGLNIVKRYLELMQGEIRVDSQPGSGSTFTFTLPRSVQPI
ncbi:MAG: GAF domain-containing protein [Deltaproteobacteria bacterium]|nr:GAF domain-containing protein [Deltaproteobacteria bacterium]